MTKLLEGIVDTAQSDQQEELRELRAEVIRLKGEINKGWELITVAQSENDQLKRVIAKLRRQLSPLYQALQLVFGEIETIPLGADPQETPGAGPSASASPQASAVWDHWRQKLGKNCSRIIDALLAHGSLNTTQLAMVTGIDRSNVPKSIHVLNKASLINKNGGVFSLKAL